MESRYTNTDNLLNLPSTIQDDILRVLKERYDNNKIYTNIGTMLLSVNPYKYLNELFSDDVLQQYSYSDNNNSNSNNYLSPHPWLVASQAYNDLCRDNNNNSNNNNKLYNQSILISGESGAGKTETTKYLMSYLARRGNSNTPMNSPNPQNNKITTNNYRGGYLSRMNSTDFEVLGSVQKKVLQTNPILDALGNARTTRNDNSSRFGKYIKLLYNKEGELLGSSLDTFLLEATRVVHQNTNERNFHIFYMICTETDPNLIKLYKIRPVRSYDYLLQSGGCFDRRDGVQDYDIYQQFLQSFAILEGNDPTNYESIFQKFGTIDGLIRAVMAVLTIGNTRFSSYLNSKGDVVNNIDPIYMKFVTDVAELLCLDNSILLAALTTKSVTINGEDFTNTLDQDQATQMRDVFSKTLYRTIFEWTIQHLNQVLSTSSSNGNNFNNDTNLLQHHNNHNNGHHGHHGHHGHNQHKHHHKHHDHNNNHNHNDHHNDHENEVNTQGIIGILDIFGFESFEVNSLEQLLINYCNENLQQQYDQVMIEKEQVLYVNEGIQWNFVEFPSAQDTITIISGIKSLSKRANLSILGLLDEACIAPSGSDASFIRQVYANLDHQKKITFTSLNKGRSEFCIHHYAGIVIYNSKDFVTKNKTFFFPLDDLLKSSQHPYFQQLEKIASKMISAKGSSSSNQSDLHNPPIHKKRISAMQISTIASTFVSNVENLLDTISQTQTHYIKCFKPNTLQVKENFDTNYMSEQLKCGGILHSLKVIRSGFPIRFTYKEFWDKYYALMVILVREAMNGEIPSDIKIKILSNDENNNNNNDNNENNNKEEEEEDCLILGISQGIDVIIQRVQLELLTKDSEIDNLLKIYENENLSLCIQRGKNIIFFRQIGYDVLSIIYNKMLGNCATLIQSHIRCMITQKRYKKIYSAIQSLQYRFRLNQQLKLWRRRLFILRRFIKKCSIVVKRRILLKNVVRKIEKLYLRRKIIKKWRPILRILAKFTKKVVLRIRQKRYGRLLAMKLLGIYRRYKITKKWKSIIKSFRLFVERCKIYAQRSIATRLEKAARLISRLLKVLILRKRLQKKRKMIIILQRWVRYGSFRKYMIRKEYLAQLFTKPVIELQKMWRWKKSVYQSIQREKEKRKIRGINLSSSSPTSASTSSLTQDSKKFLGKESILSLYTQVDTTGQKDINPKILLHSNRNILWTIFSYYSDNKHCSIPSNEKKYQIGITSERNLIKLFREWGIIPAVLPLTICQQTILERGDEIHTNDDHNNNNNNNNNQNSGHISNGYYSYHQFCRILLFLSTEIIKRPECPALTTDNHITPIMSICNADSIYLNPILMPMIGIGLRWLLTTMDRSEGRNKFTNLRSSVVIPSFHGVLGSKLFTNTVPLSSSQTKLKQYNSTHRYRLGNIKSGPMSSDVQALIKRNESILVSMALRYSGKDYRSSYYGRIDLTTTTTSSSSTPNINSSPSHNNNNNNNNSDQQQYESNEREYNDDHDQSNNKYHASPSVRASMIKRDHMRKEAVGLTFDGLWNLMNDFGVCPEHCSKSTLREICEVAMHDSPFPREDGMYGYEDYIEILNLIAQNSYNNRSEFGSTEDRMSNLFSSMNKSGGRQRLIDIDRNALIIPPLYLSLKESTGSTLRASSSNFNQIGTSSFGSTSASRRSLTPPPTGLRSKTPPPTSLSSRNKTPPPTKKRNTILTTTPTTTSSSSSSSSTTLSQNFQSNQQRNIQRSKTPPATSRSSSSSISLNDPGFNSFNNRPLSFGNRRISAPSSLGGSIGGYNVSNKDDSKDDGTQKDNELFHTNLNSNTDENRLSIESLILPNGKLSRIPIPNINTKGLESPSNKNDVNSPSTPVDSSGNRLSIGRRSGIPQRSGPSSATKIPHSTK